MPVRFVQISNTGKMLSRMLADLGMPLDARCGGHGRCGRCTVTLSDGLWAVSGVPVRTPCRALACRAALLSPRGAVMVPEEALLSAAIDGSGLAEWSGNPMTAAAGIAVGFDIGTTTLAAAAFQDGMPLGTVSRYNPQAAFGDNIMARISASRAHLGEMRGCLLQAMAEMLAELRLPKTPLRIAVAGNSTMTCLFHGIDPFPMGSHPFTVPRRAFASVSADCLGLPADVPLLTAPLASAFIGGDCVAGLGEHELKPCELFLDLGTNCEMVLRLPDGRLVGTAAAAGPAFEGAGISCGSRAVPGAVCAYRSREDIDVLGGGAPKGFCGSGLVDVLAVLREEGMLSEFGRFQPPAPSLEPVCGVGISEKDVETLLTAKAAVAAGIRILQRHCGVQVTRLVLAGAFAQVLNLEHARAIGLLPDVPADFIGNASLAGAVRLACDPGRSGKLEAIRVEELLLNDEPDFGDAFVEAMRLKPMEF